MDRDMRRIAWLLVLLPLAGCVLVPLNGCGSSTATPEGQATQTSAGTSQDGPDVAVFKFLDAVRTGNNATASNMLTKVAQQKTKEMDLVLAPTGSDTAKVKVGEVRLIGDEGAHVSSTWTDLGEDGKTPVDEEFVWIVRKDPEGWRIAGMAVEVFPNEPPLILNFEDPQDMERKQRAVEAEMIRRSQVQTAAESKASAAASAAVGQDPFTQPAAQVPGQVPGQLPAAGGPAATQAQKPATGAVPLK